MSETAVLLLPGWQNSGPGHWQTRWEIALGFHRVEQHDWMRPLRGDWISRLEDVVQAVPGHIVMCAHSLGCQLVAAWASLSSSVHRVKGAMLVAPGDTQHAPLSELLGSWREPVMQPLPFPSTLVASTDDPYCRFERAGLFASAWGSTFLSMGACGHINAESGLGDWPQGQELLRALREL